MDIRYVAGMMDGEGHVRKDRRQIIISQNLRDDMVLYKMAAFLESKGVESRVIPRKNRPAIGDLFVSQVENLWSFCVMIEPHLIVKRVEVRDLMSRLLKDQYRLGLDRIGRMV